MKKYSINDFFAGNVDIRCKNNKQALSLLKECDKRGVVWDNNLKATSILNLMPVLEMDFFGNGRLTQSNGHAERNVVDFDQIDFCPCKTSYQILIDCDGTTTTATMTRNGREVKTAIARRNQEDKFDWRKGAELAFERLWNSPKKLGEKPEVREVKRWAKPGEYIKFSSVHGDCERYKNGDILKVESVIEVCGEDGFAQIACCGVIATPDEYVVLEGYRP
jgi:hypothetical protein|uniref:Uncharacterized protein n=1 Tax=Siphoviridae sp. ctS1E53 TaxID=2826340 RepID=A0A8S5MEC5_9CAUD|nr:MAG TPA: hypothetical protein [Siphoviridae sp. ctS1E53]